MTRNEQGQFQPEVSDKPKIYIRQEAEHYYGATLPDGTTVGATSLGRMARYLRSQGYQVTLRPPSDADVAPGLGRNAF